MGVQMKDILMISDNSEIISLTEEVLEAEFHMISRKTEKEALELLSYKLPDMVVIDHNGTTIDGLCLIKRIKGYDELREVPIILLVNGEEEALERECLELGAQDFLLKPFCKTAVLGRVRRILELEELKRNLEGRIQRTNLEMNEIKDLAQRDPLTGVWNRTYTEKVVNEYLIERRHHGALFMIDIDNFKNINDTYGHIVGDEILTEFARVIQALTRQNDIVCRMGGDEFIVFLKDISSHSIIAEKAEQVLVTLEKRLIKPDTKESVSVSMGIAVSPGDGKSFARLYQNADKSLYFVKQNGKNSYHFYSEEGENETRALRQRSTQVDLEHLKEFIEEMDYKKGAYQVEYDGFKKIYRFVARCIGRTGQSVQTVLFTLTDHEGNLPALEHLIFAMENLEHAVHSSIRRGDVATNYSSSQFVVILMDSSNEDGIMVAERIVHTYKEFHHQEEEVELHYAIQGVTAAPVSKDFDGEW